MRLLSGFFFVLCLVFVQNCGLSFKQTRSLDQFSSSAIRTAEMSEEELIRMRVSVIEMNLARFTLANIEAEEPGYEKAEETLTVPNISVRIQAIHALKSYGTLIQVLANENLALEAETATQNFLDSTDFLQPEDKRMSSEQKSKIVNSVKILTGLWSNYRKKEALQQIVLNTKSQIEILCNLLISEFDYKNEKKLGLQHQITTNRLLLSAQESYDNSEQAKDKTKALKIFRIAQKNKTRREEIYPKIVESLKLLKKSNQELADSFEKPDYMPESIKELAQTVQRMKELASILK